MSDRPQADRPPLAQRLDLQPHPEGGWFRQTWRSPVSFEPAGYGGPRRAATAIYFLLHPGERSRWHVVRSDELWLWHSGGPLELRTGGSGAAPAAGEPVLLGGGPERRAAAPGAHPRRHLAVRPGRASSPSWSAASWPPASSSRTSAWPMAHRG